MWESYAHVLPSFADPNMAKHRGEAALKCTTAHGSGWDLYGSKKGNAGAKTKDLYCPECRKVMRETTSFWLPPGKFVYQLRLGWGIDAEGDVVNEEGVLIDEGNNNVLVYVDEGKDAWKSGNGWKTSKPEPVHDQFPTFTAGSRHATTKTGRAYKGVWDNFSSLATFHSRRFTNRAVEWVAEMGGEALVNVALQGMCQAINRKLSAGNTSFDITTDWFLPQDVEDWVNHEHSLDRFYSDIGVEVPKSRKRSSKQKKNKNTSDHEGSDEEEQRPKKRVR
ncbi:uncharacterized protein N0V89_000212 [Didymosphaeria variabile]|uniref:Uncharacterized protein n=1 Tax=Didymosphaeria variabile TaxID=1932322 RepID=A0A9W9CFI2_9PLEO|nr:uncharacterized protein N0V89_000212 [Didymosphaeria variabile]KAJ4359657.1 hypothetical protein N0V89_000212 [Didymosphaeria variabile]